MKQMIHTEKVNRQSLRSKCRYRVSAMFMEGYCETMGHCVVCAE